MGSRLTRPKEYEITCDAVNITFLFLLFDIFQVALCLGATIYDFANLLPDVRGKIDLICYTDQACLGLDQKLIRAVPSGGAGGAVAPPRKIKC